MANILSHSLQKYLKDIEHTSVFVLGRYVFLAVQSFL